MNISMSWRCMGVRHRAININIGSFFMFSNVQIITSAILLQIFELYKSSIGPYLRPRGEETAEEDQGAAASIILSAGEFCC